MQPQPRRTIATCHSRTAPPQALGPGLRYVPQPHSATADQGYALCHIRTVSPLRPGPSPTRGRALPIQRRGEVWRPCNEEDDSHGEMGNVHWYITWVVIFMSVLPSKHNDALWLWTAFNCLGIAMWPARWLLLQIFAPQPKHNFATFRIGLISACERPRGGISAKLTSLCTVATSTYIPL